MRDGVTGIGPVDDLVRLAVDGQDRARLPVGDPDLVLRPVREETVRVAVLGGDDVLDLPGRRIDHRGRTRPLLLRMLEPLQHGPHLTNARHLRGRARDAVLGRVHQVALLVLRRRQLGVDRHHTAHERMDVAEVLVEARLVELHLVDVLEHAGVERHRRIGPRRDRVPRMGARPHDPADAVTGLHVHHAWIEELAVELGHLDGVRRARAGTDDELAFHVVVAGTLGGIGEAPAAAHQTIVAGLLGDELDVGRLSGRQLDVEVERGDAEAVLDVLGGDIEHDTIAFLDFDRRRCPTPHARFHGEGLHSAAGSHCGRPLRVRHGGGHEDEEKTTDHKNELAHERASFARPELRPCGGDGGATRVPRAKPRSFRARSCGARSCV